MRLNKQVVSLTILLLTLLVNVYPVMGVNDSVKKINEFLDTAEVQLSQFHYDSAILYLDSANFLAREFDNQIQVAHVNRLKGRVFIRENNYDTALIYLNKSRLLAKQLHNDTILAMTYINIAYILDNEGKSDSALKLYHESLKLFKAANDNYGMGKVFNELSIHFKYSGDFDKGLENALKANYIFSKLNKPAALAKSFINLGNIYEKLGEHDTALACYERSYQIGEQINDTKIPSTSLINKIVIYWHWGNDEMNKGDSLKAVELYRKSKKEFLRALAFSKSINDMATEAMLYSNISIIYRILAEYNEAIEAAQTAISISKQVNNLTYELNALNNLGVTYKVMGSYKKAASSFHKCLELAKSAKQKEAIKKACNNLTDVYELQGNYKTALEYSRLAAVYKDSLFNEAKQKLIEKHKTNYEILHLKDLNQITRLKEAKIRQERNITYIIASTLIVVLLLVIIFFRMRARKNRIIAAQKIQKLEDEKKLMAAQSVLVGQEKERERIARELHDGIGVLLSTASIHFSSVEAKADKETGEMLKKANKLLREAGKEVRQISHNMMPGVLSKFGLKEAIEDLFEKVEESGEVKVDLKLDTGDGRLPENIEIMLYRVIQEMINNTLKHAKASKITFSLLREDDKIRMEYADNGVGFEEEKLPKDKTLGLSGIRSRVDFLGGTMKMESRPGKGTRYSIIVPLNGKNV